MSENDSWAIVELMGHVAMAGRVTKPGEFGGLWQIDIPDDDKYRTEFFGSGSVYRIRMVSEEIARAYARPGREIIAYDAPIITREEHEAAMQQARERIIDLREQNEELKKQVYALPTGQSSEAIPGVADEISELWNNDSDNENDDDE